MLVTPIKTRLFSEKENLAWFITEHVPQLKNGSIVAICSKIVALSEGRVAIVHSREEKEALIKKESTWMKQVLPEWWLTVRDGTLAVNAGIDASNVDDAGGSEGIVLLLPVDPFASAEAVRAELIKHYGTNNCGVVITDSRISPLRAGVLGVGIGYAGFKGVRDYRGIPDLFGRALDVTQTDITDSLATAATLVCGEGSERQPLAVIEEAPVEWTEAVDRSELQ